jgi:hypothetical protein
MSKHAILERVFPVRFRAIEALGAAPKPDGGRALHEVAEEARQTPAVTRWRALAETLDIAGLLMEWQGAVTSAAIDADRFLRAARARLKDLREHASDDPYCVRLLDILSAIDGELTSKDIKGLREKISSVPLPVAIYADPVPQRPQWGAAVRWAMSTAEWARGARTGMVDYHGNRQRPHILLAVWKATADAPQNRARLGRQDYRENQGI